MTLKLSISPRHISFAKMNSHLLRLPWWKNHSPPLDVLSWRSENLFLYMQYVKSHTYDYEEEHCRSMIMNKGWAVSCSCCCLLPQWSKSTSFLFPLLCQTTLFQICWSTFYRLDSDSRLLCGVRFTFILFASGVKEARCRVEVRRRSQRGHRGGWFSFCSCPYRVNYVVDEGITLLLEPWGMELIFQWERKKC